MLGLLYGVLSHLEPSVNPGTGLVTRPEPQRAGHRQDPTYSSLSSTDQAPSSQLKGRTTPGPPRGSSWTDAADKKTWKSCCRARAWDHLGPPGIATGQSGGCSTAPCEPQLSLRFPLVKPTSHGSCHKKQDPMLPVKESGSVQECSTAERSTAPSPFEKNVVEDKRMQRRNRT
ncbi:hypothetical protein GN956_G15168 [Arapaima gigas]